MLPISWCEKCKTESCQSPKILDELKNLIEVCMKNNYIVKQYRFDNRMLSPMLGGGVTKQVFIDPEYGLQFDYYAAIKGDNRDPGVDSYVHVLMPVSSICLSAAHNHYLHSGAWWNHIEERIVPLFKFAIEQQQNQSLDKKLKKMTAEELKDQLEKAAVYEEWHKINLINIAANGGGCNHG